MDNPLPVDLIREVFHYQSRFEGSTMVFKIDCPVMEDPAFAGLVKDLALLAKTGFKVIVVPGARESIDQALRQHDIASSSTSIADIPVRITTSAAIPFVEMAAFNAASRFMTLLSGSRVEALIGNFVRARGLGVRDGVDMEHTGAVDKIYADSLSRVLNLGMIPILPCIGWSPSGKPYNVPSDEIALAVSAALGAVKLFIVSIHDGLREALRANFYNLPQKPQTRADGRLVRLTTQEAETLLAANGAFNGKTEGENTSWRQYLGELKLALRASRAGVHRVHIIDGREEGAVLKELFSNLGVGTMIYADEYDSIRPLRSSDMPDVLRLMEPLMQRGILIRRSAERIQEWKDDYAVFEIDGSVRACAALHDWGQAQGEIAGVATDPLYADMALGRRIVSFLIEKARRNRIRRVFALTTQTQDWFEMLGFEEAEVDTLPEQKRKVYDQSRKSKVFALNL